MPCASRPPGPTQATFERRTDGQDLEIDPGLTVVVSERVLPRRLRAHAFAALVIGGCLLRGALRFLPTSTAAAAGSNGASTACTAR